MNKILVADYIFRGNVRIYEKLYHHGEVIAMGSHNKMLKQ